VLKLQIVENLADIAAVQWDALRQGCAGNNPFLAHAFLLALQESGCASPATGWRAQFITLWRADRLVAALPLYVKTHSWGEFVFDWAWAEAYQQHGLDYYPKLVSAVPFTPVTGARLLADAAAGDAAEMRAQLIAAALHLAQAAGVSSLHCLFPRETQAQEMQQHGMLLRRGVQLHWRNPGYADFADYLASMRRDKRKKIQQERRKVNDAGIHFQHVRGEQITPEQWAFFMRCYRRTHEQFNAPLALNLDFFMRIGAAMPQHILLIVALNANDEPIASAINFYDADALYGRSWGTLAFHPGLHFETCYYQAIEFCIANNLATFEGGAQGEHKLARGFLPVTTWSAHWLAHPRFASAVEDFLHRETGGIERYIDELNESSPFKRQQADA